MPGKEGLVHISELSNDYIGKVEDVIKMGDEIKVKLIGIDDQKRLKLSKKTALKKKRKSKALGRNIYACYGQTGVYKSSPYIRSKRYARRHITIIYGHSHI